MRWGRRGGEGRKGKGRGGEYRHFFLYTLSTVPRYEYSSCKQQVININK